MSEREETEFFSVGSDTVTEMSSTSMMEELHEVGGQDPLLDAVKITKAAFQAKQQCEDLKYQVESIENLAQQARETYGNVYEVAMGLASTATAVASMALKNCAFSSFQEAFKKSSKYKHEMSLDDFMSIISSTRESSEEKINSLKYAPSPPSRNSNSWPDSTERSKPKTSKEKVQPGKGSFKPQDSPINFHQGQGRRRLSLPTDQALYHYQNGNQKSEKSNSEQHSTSFKDFLGEKYPVGVSPSDYKESLEETFTASLTSMQPLWEDRYIDMSKTKDGIGSRAGYSNSHGHGSHDPTTWSEKKSLKQFQMKLQQVVPLTDVEDQLTGSDRPSNPTPPDNPRLLTPVMAPTIPPPHVHRLHPQHDNTDDDERYDDAREAFDDPRDCEIASLLGRRLVSTVMEADERQTEAQRLNMSPAQRNRSISPLLNKEEKVNYGVVRDDKPSQQEKHLFQPKKFQ